MRGVRAPKIYLRPPRDGFKYSRSLQRSPQEANILLQTQPSEKSMCLAFSLFLFRWVPPEASRWLQYGPRAPKSTPRAPPQEGPQGSQEVPKGAPGGAPQDSPKKAPEASNTSPKEPYDCPKRLTRRSQNERSSRS